MDELIYIAMYLINFGLCTLAFAITRAALPVVGNVKASLNRFTVVAIAIGILTGFPLLYGLLCLFESAGRRVNLGHGEGLIAAPLMNFAIAILLAVIGRILLRWTPIRW